MSANQRIFLVGCGVVLIVVLGFYCVYNPDCTFCRIMEAFN
jgi:hypothetical protein